MKGFSNVFEIERTAIENNHTHTHSPLYFMVTTNQSQNQVGQKIKTKKGRQRSSGQRPAPQGGSCEGRKLSTHFPSFLPTQRQGHGVGNFIAFFSWMFIEQWRNKAAKDLPSKLYSLSEASYSAEYATQKSSW